jgi:hypothetical protein
LEEAQRANSMTNVQRQQPQQQPSNEAVNATVEHPQTVAGATTPSTQPPAAAPIAPVAASSVPASTTTKTPQPGAGAMPQALMNSGKPECFMCDRITREANAFTVQDEGLKNLMMSWYYAGYYTGLLEGQQKAYASMQEGG